MKRFLEEGEMIFHFFSWLVGWLLVGFFWGGGERVRCDGRGTSSFDHLLEEGFGLWKLYIFDTVYNQFIGGLWVRVLEVWEG